MTAEYGTVYLRIGNEVHHIWKREVHIYTEIYGTVFRCLLHRFITTESEIPWYSMNFPMYKYNLSKNNVMMIVYSINRTQITKTL